MIVNKRNSGGGGGSYTLPVASQSTLGGVKVGSGLTIDTGGTLSAEGYALPVASDSTLGGVKVGEGLTIDSGGTISAEGGVAQYDLDAMTQSERAEFVAMCENLTELEREELFVYRDKSICRYDHTEGSGNSFKIGFSDYRQDGWDYPTTYFRHFFITADGSYQQLGNGVYPNIITYDTTYSDTAHTLSSSDNLSPLIPVSNLGPGDAKVALNLRLLVGNKQTVLSSNAWSERTGNFEGRIGAEWHYSGNVITAVWNVVEHNATIASWTEVPEGGSSAGGDYVIVDSLSEITSPTEGMIAFVPEHQETYSGLSMDGGQLAYQAYLIKYAPREIEYAFSDSHNFNTNNPNSAPYDFDSDEQGNWHSIWDESVWLRYDSVQDRTYCVAKSGFSVICYLSSESYEEITTAVTISPKTYIYRNSNWLRYEDGLISFRLDTIATMAEWTAFIANAKAFAPGDFQFVVDYYYYGWNTYKFKTREGYELDDFNGYTFVCKASNGESTDEASALSLKVQNGSEKSYGIAKYDLMPTWSQTVTAGTQIASVTINGETTNVYAPEAAGGGGDYVVVDSLSEIATPTEGMIAFVRAGQKTLSGYTFDMSVVGDYSVRLKINNPTERSWQVHKRWDEGWMTSTSGRKTDMWLRFGTDGVVRSFYMESIAGCYSNNMYTLVVDPDIWTWQISTSSENYTETAVTFNTPDREYIYVNNSWQHYENGKITFYLNTLNSNEYDAVSAITQQYPPEEIQLAADYRRDIYSPIKYYTFPISNGVLNDRITTEAVFESTPQSETIPNVDAMAAIMMFGGYREWGLLIQSVMNTNVFIDFQESGSTLTSSQGDDIRLQLNSQVSNSNTWARIVPRIKNEDGSKYISIGSDLLFWLYDSSHDFRTKYFRFAFRYIDASGDTYDTKWSYANGTLTCDSKTLVS